MGIQDRDYYWEKRGGVRPGKWARLRASLWLVQCRLVNKFSRLHWSLRAVVWLFAVIVLVVLYRWGRAAL
jgi:hypothetical protein